jgi:hypothetical protein
MKSAASASTSGDVGESHDDPASSAVKARCKPGAPQGYQLRLCCGLLLLGYPGSGRPSRTSHTGSTRSHGNKSKKHPRRHSDEGRRQPPDEVRLQRDASSNA